MAAWTRIDDDMAALGLVVIGDGVRSGRHRIRLTQQQLSGEVGLSQSTISKLENGRLHALRMRKLAEVVGYLESRSSYKFPAGPPPDVWELRAARARLAAELEDDLDDADEIDGLDEAAEAGEVGEAADDG